MRKFKLQNALGESFDLMRRDAYFQSPEGLGVEYSNRYARVGTNFIPTQNEIAQGSISGEMWFKGYAQYTEFRKHIAKQPLKLLYTINDTTYTIDCRIGSLEKAEISNRTGLLQCAIDFDCTSLWYIRRKPEWTAAVDVVGGKVYSYQYDYTYREALANQIRETNYSDMESPAIITIYGPVVDPEWRILVNGKAVSSGALTATISSGHKLVINSVDDQLEIAEYDADGTYLRDLYQTVDFDKTNFMYLPSGNCVMTFQSGDGSNVSASLELLELYETV